MERVCSINPPLSFVANIGKSDFMREIVIEKDSMNDPNVWSVKTQLLFM